jgi:hypothetical protein
MNTLNKPGLGFNPLQVNHIFCNYGLQTTDYGLQVFLRPFTYLFRRVYSKTLYN